MNKFTLHFLFTLFNYLFSVYLFIIIDVMAGENMDENLGIQFTNGILSHKQQITKTTMYTIWIGIISLLIWQTTTL